MTPFYVAITEVIKILINKRRKSCICMRIAMGFFARWFHLFFALSISLSHYSVFHWLFYHVCKIVWLTYMGTGSLKCLCIIVKHIKMMLKHLHRWASKWGMNERNAIKIINDQIQIVWFTKLSQRFVLFFLVFDRQR